MIFDYGSEGGGIVVLGSSEIVNQIALNISTFSALMVENVDLPENYGDFVNMLKEKSPKFVIGDESAYEYLLRYSQEGGIPAIFKPLSVEYDLASGGLLVKCRVGERFAATLSVNGDRIVIAV
ncbi:MAG: hypothetical protein ABIL16_01475 [candidate division WOR-3 bacterium]